MANDLTENKVMTLLNWSYEKAVRGVAGLDSADDLAEDYMKRNDS